jgi:hypothetical protein
MSFFPGGGRRALPSMAYSRPSAAQMGLLSDELWPVPQFVSSGGAVVGDQKPAAKDARADTDDTPTDGGADEPAGLPASVVNLYREKLDKEGRDYLARGPRTFEEQLAYAQQVRPNAYENSRLASLDDQQRFRQWREVDWVNNFIGPDGIVYVRDHSMGNEKPEARIFRAYENVVGGFKRPQLEDLLDQFDLPDPLEGYSPETRAKIADVENFDRPLSANEAAWRAWAKAQKVNPSTWFMGDPLPQSYQTDYRLGHSRDVPPGLIGAVFIGRDGLIYSQNDRTQPDRGMRFADALEREREKDALYDAPLPDPTDALVLGWGSAGPGFAGVIRNPFGKRGSPTTQEDLEAILNEIRPLNRKDKEHVAGGRNEKGEPIPEERIPGPGGGQKGSISPDATIVTKGGHVIRIEQQDMDMKTGKASEREIGKQQTEFNRTQSQGYNVPWSYVLGILKADHMRKYQEKLERQKRPKRRPQRDEDDDN